MIENGQQHSKKERKCSIEIETQWINFSIVQNYFWKFSREKKCTQQQRRRSKKKSDLDFLLVSFIAFKIPDQNKKKEKKNLFPMSCCWMLRVFSVCAFIPFASHERHRSHLQHNSFSSYFFHFILFKNSWLTVWPLCLSTFA